MEIFSEKYFNVARLTSASSNLAVVAHFYSLNPSSTMGSPRSKSVGSNQNVVEGRREKRRSNSAETGGILPPVPRETSGQIPIQIPTEPSSNCPPPLQQVNPGGYSITDDPSFPSLQDSSRSYRPPFQPIGQQGELPNVHGPSLGWPPSYPQTRFPYQQQHSVPLNGYRSSEAIQIQGITLSPPLHVDLNSYPTCLTICSFL